jgi:DNA-binding Xre family transcriptional regulator|tara:strand:+ start:4377 stop:4589 length:213 start_codon:yes stop_codon:yes gene_type:complete
MNLNRKRQEIISFAMYKNKISKLQLSKALGMSYPTMLSKLKSTGDFKLSEADNLCNYLNIELTEFITLKN